MSSQPAPPATPPKNPYKEQSKKVRQSPRLKRDEEVADEGYDTPTFPSSPVSPSFFDADLLTPQPSLSPTTAKAARAALNIQKVRKKIAAKSAARGKKKSFAKTMSSSSQTKKNSGQVRQRVETKRNKKPVAKRQKRGKKMTRNNFFDESDTDDSKNFGRGHDEDEEDSFAEREEIGSVDNVGGVDGVAEEEDDDDVVGRHREVFLSKLLVMAKTNQTMLFVALKPRFSILSLSFNTGTK